MTHNKITFPEPIEKAIVPLNRAQIDRPETIQPEAPKMLTREQVAGLLKVSLQTVINYTNRGYLTAYKIGRRVLYNEAEVFEAIQSCAVQRYQHEKTREFVFKY